ncbi:hypothetical protein [Cryptosporangium phraense]|uniref:Uncharacterized protein n=1 Tax=Cryptosporangium phraense TaxID=2593070 RepID=A0A545ASL6_9ACTN|nr:hypothetical protein [Cryptosporangium phraense]TQS44330.1 hypothetical protein FL583_15470 [Cryptosporangium phraense]
MSDIRDVAVPIVQAALADKYLPNRAAREAGQFVVEELIAAELLELPDGFEVEDFVSPIVAAPVPGEEELRQTERARVARRVWEFYTDPARWPQRAQDTTGEFRQGWLFALEELTRMFDAGAFGGNH